MWLQASQLLLPAQPLLLYLKWLRAAQLTQLAAGAPQLPWAAQAGVRPRSPVQLQAAAQPQLEQQWVAVSATLAGTLPLTTAQLEAGAQPLAAGQPHAGAPPQLKQHWAAAWGQLELLKEQPLITAQRQAAPCLQLHQQQAAAWAPLARGQPAAIAKAVQPPLRQQ